MITAGLLYLGFFALAASMSRHALLLPGPSAVPGRAKWLRLAGWASLLSSLAVALSRRDWPVAIVTWLGLAPVTAGTILIGLVFGTAGPRAGAAIAAALVAAGFATGNP